VKIHKSAEIDASAVLGENVSVGPFSIIGPGVRIGDNTEIGSHVLLVSTEIGPDCRVFHGACIGEEPQIAGFKNTASCVEIGQGTVIREFVTIHRGAKEGQKTKIGKHCLLMNYVHIAHDCEVGDHVVIVNYTGLSGHVVVEDYAFVSGQVGVHQFVRIGKNAMVGGKAGVNQDILPFTMVEGTPARLVGTNSIGLRRKNFSPEVRSAIKKSLKYLLAPEMNTSQAVARMQAEFEMVDEIRYLVNFIKNSSRGITK